MKPRKVRPFFNDLRDGVPIGTELEEMILIESKIAPVLYLKFPPNIAKCCQLNPRFLQ